MATANYQDEITIVANPDIGYTVGIVTVKDAGGTDIPVIDSKFAMPAKDVIVNVKFEPLRGTINDKDYVLIGGKKWATMNIGASSLSERGNLYAWGEISPKSEYTPANYSVNISTNIAPDSGCDAARANWGGTWRMPTQDDYKTLVLACGGYNIASDVNATQLAAKHIDNGKLKKGTYILKSSTQISLLSGIEELKDITLLGFLLSDGENYLFFPFGTDNTNGKFWSSNKDSNASYAGCLSFTQNTYNWASRTFRYFGISIRPVSD